MAAKPYEFDVDQNRLISDLAKKMTGVGSFLIGLGLLLAATALYSLWADLGGRFWMPLLPGVFFTVTGAFSLRGGRSFRRVVDTENRDIEHLMLALTQLDRFYTVNFWLVVACILLFIVGVFSVPAAGSSPTGF